MSRGGSRRLQLRGALDAEQIKLDVRARYQVELVFEEIVGNIVRYGAPQACTPDHNRLVITLAAL